MVCKESIVVTGWGIFCPNYILEVNPVYSTVIILFLSSQFHGFYCLLFCLFLKNSVYILLLNVFHILGAWFELHIFALAFFYTCVGVGVGLFDREFFAVFTKEFSFCHIIPGTMQYVFFSTVAASLGLSA